MIEQSHRTREVFGISRDVPLNYVTRKSVDEHLVNNLTKDRHVVVFGSSKQRKTCLRKHSLDIDDYIVIQCSNRWDLSQLHATILKIAGFRIEISDKKTISGKNKLVASGSASLLGVGIKGQAEIERSNKAEKTITPIELDPEDTNEIISALQSIDFNRFIVLEDFHYLPQDTQRDFAVALKAFHEASNLCFIIVGVWLEENRLIVYNGDLTGRIATVNADHWTPDELREVIEVGETLLNIGFSSRFKYDLLDQCMESIYVVQEVCRKACEDAEIHITLKDYKEIGTDIDVRLLIKNVVDEQSARYNSFLVQFADGFQQTDLQMYRWILYPILTCPPSDLDQGLRYPQINEIIQSKHPRGEMLNPGNLTVALQSSANLQVQKGIQPIIIDFDSTSRRLNVVDKSFLIWLRFQERNEVLKIAGLPY